MYRQRRRDHPLSGTYTPLYHPISTEEALKALAALQMPLDMFRDNGVTVFIGQVKIKKLSFKSKRWIGNEPLTVDFSMELDEYGN